MKKQKKRIYTVALGLLASACASSALLGLNGLSTAKAAVSEVPVYSDDFNAVTLSDNWTATGAKLSSEYASLRVQPNEYAWPGHILCQGYTLKGSCRLEMTVQELPAENTSWFALSFGSPSSISIFEKASGALIFAQDNTLLFKNGANTGTAFAYSPKGYVVNRQAVTVILDFAKRDNGAYDITYTLKQDGETLGSTLVENFEVQDGYFGFNSYGTPFDVLSFDVYESNEKVYADDFTSSVMSYDDKVIKDSQWVALSPFKSTTVSIAPVGKLDISEVGASAVYKEAFVKKSTEVATLYQLSAQFDFSNAKEGVATGFEIGKATPDADGIFVGLLRKASGYQMILSAGEHKETIFLAENPSDGILNVTLAAKYNNSIDITINGFQTGFELDASVEGYIAMTTSDDYATDGAGALVDDFSFQRYTYTNSGSKDMKINFEGTRELEDEDGKYYQYYFATKDWYAGSNVRVANHGYTENGYVLFGNASVDSCFGPKQKYGDCIIRFDVTFVGSDYYYDKPDTYFDTADGRGVCDAECFGVQFGSTSYKNIYNNAQSLGIATYNGKSIYYTTNCTRATAQEEIVHIPNQPQTPENEYDLFRKSATYNFMYIIKNGTVSMHFKEAGEDESVLGIVREYVTGVETNGYVAVYGANGVDFRLDNLSITDLDRGYTSSAYTDGEDIETLRVDTTQGDTLSAFDLENNTLTTKGVTGSNITRVTLGETNGLSYKQGSLEIIFAEKSATVSDGVNRKDISFDMPLLLNGATLEISRIGDTVSIGFANAGAPLSVIDGNTYSVSGMKMAGREKIALSGNGVSKIRKISVFNLDSNVAIEARNFNAETDIMQPWVKRKNIQGKGCGSSIGISAAVAALLPAAWILKRKENENE
ncbi:MAG: hypothetical protein E7371_05190 [Clostridiales bacterium]|nr:hypothetical protein [Clostridiales bacterium]